MRVHAVMHLSILKKPELDPALPEMYRPISNLPFISKFLEKIFSVQLLTILESNRIFEKFQSGFHKKSTAQRQSHK